MKIRVIPLALALSLALTGCASMLERPYLRVSPHEAVSAGENSSSALRVENYQDLVNAILYLVTEGEEHGVLGLYNYTSDVESDLTRACVEVGQEDPLGAYAVEYIRHDYALIVSYYEANIYITYRRTPEQVDAIISVTGTSAIRRALRNVLADFSPEAVLRVNYFAGGDEQYFLDLLHQAYYDAPVSALGMPEVKVKLYPDTGLQRIVEFTLTYPEDRGTLLRRGRLLTQRLEELSPLPAAAEELAGLVRDGLVVTDEKGYSTAYHALVEGQADSEGAALAYQLLCDRAGVTCLLVQGTLNGAPHFWNIVTDDGKTYYHVDLSAELFALSDEELTGADGYQWDREEYPACVSTEPDGQEKEIEN